MVTIATYKDLAIPLQYIEEETKGTTPTLGTASWIGLEQTIGIDVDMGDIITFQANSRDPAAISKTLISSGINITYVMQNTNFLQLGVNTTNDSKTHSYHCQITLGGSTARHYLWAYGKIARAGWTQAVGAETMGSAVILVQQPANTDPSFTDASDPGTDPLTFLSPGADPITVNTDNPEVVAFSCIVDNNLQIGYAIGDDEYVDVVVGERRFTGSFTMLSESTTEFDWLVGDTEFTLTDKISSTETATLSNVKLTRVRQPFSPLNEITETYAFTGLSISIA